MSRVLLSALLLLTTFSLPAQQLRTITGTVYSTERAKKVFTEGATIVAAGTANGTRTNEIGRFVLTIPDTVTAIIISYIGYQTDTMYLTKSDSTLEIELTREHSLKDFTVREKTKSTEISIHSTINMETIGQKELLKAACCNLSESFETTPSIDVSFTDAVTGYKQIKMLGLAGYYTLITQENIPSVRGLSAITGLTYTPGTWIESMQLSKGTGSVVNGFEGVAGQLNVELRKPFSGERWLFNLYQSSQGRTEANVNYRHKFSEKLGTNLLLHASGQWLKNDQNGDHFIDEPLGNQFNILNRWIYTTDNGWMLQAGIKFVHAEGIGGNWMYTKNEPQGPGYPWGYQFNTTNIEDWAKIAKVFHKRAGTSIGLQLSNTEYSQDAIYGPREYIGKQSGFYANLIFQTYIGNTSNIIKAGTSEVVDKYNEKFAGALYERTESVPGVFTEYSYNHGDKYNVVAGLRADDNNIYGAFVTPRLHVRYAPFKKTVIRASIGRAQRTANILAENAGFMAGNRQFDIIKPEAGKAYGLNPEVSWNTGINLTHKFKIGLREAVLALDYYYTWFQSQVVVDLEYPGILSFYNLNGRSYAHSFQAQFDYELIHDLDLRVAYRYYNVMTTYQGEMKEKPLVAPHRGFVNVAYKTRNDWKFDYTVQYVSAQRTPNVSHTNHIGLGSGGLNSSPAFITMNVQATKVLSATFELYGGVENITNYMQHDAIIDVANPQAPDFDASMIWGPMMGINGYVGFRYKIK